LLGPKAIQPPSQRDFQVGKSAVAISKNQQPTTNNQEPRTKNQEPRTDFKHFPSIGEREFKNLSCFRFSFGMEVRKLTAETSTIFLG